MTTIFIGTLIARPTGTTKIEVKILRCSTTSVIIPHAIKKTFNNAYPDVM